MSSNNKEPKARETGSGLLANTSPTRGVKGTTFDLAIASANLIDGIDRIAQFVLEINAKKDILVGLRTSVDKSTWGTNTEISDEEDLLKALEQNLSVARTEMSELEREIADFESGGATVFRVAETKEESKGNSPKTFATAASSHTETQPLVERPEENWLSKYVDLSARKAAVRNVAFLQRKAILEVSQRDNTWIFPKNFPTLAPRLAYLLEHGCLIAGGVALFTGSNIDTVLYPEAWSNDQDTATKFLSSIMTDGSRKLQGEAILSVLDFFQSLQFGLEDTLRSTAGYVHTSSLFVEIHDEIRNDIPRSKTRAALNRTVVRNGLLAQIRSLIPGSQDFATTLFASVEMILQKIYNVIIRDETNDAYIFAVRRIASPSATSLAAAFYRTVQQEIVTKSIVKKKTVEEKTVKTSVRPPSVPSSDKEVIQYTTAPERTFLTALNTAISLVGSKAFLARIDRPADAPVVRSEKIGKVIDRAYSVQNAVKNVLKERQTNIKGSCITYSKKCIAEKKEGTIKDYFTSDLWNRTKNEYLDSEKTCEMDESVRNALNVGITPDGESDLTGEKLIQALLEFVLVGNS